MRLQTELTVELDSGETYTVKADQRDYAALEVSDIADGLAHTRARHLAWTAAKRAKRYSGTWQAFNEVDCAEVSVADEEGDESLDPGSTDQTVGV